MFIAKSFLIGIVFSVHIQPLIAALEPRQASLGWFEDQRYGMFIHWGPSVIHGGKYPYTDLSWSRGGTPPDPWCGGGPIPADIYDRSFLTFNPMQYDPAAWVRLAKEAGMRYVIITTRHHDGFSMFDTQQSEFKITHPEGAYRQWIAGRHPDWTQAQVNRRADILRQFVDAVHEGGLGLGFYYSEPDWIREDYRIGLTGKDNAGQSVSKERQEAAIKTYQDFMHAQLQELTTQYGKVDILWFDAIKPSQVKEHGWNAIWIRQDTLDMIRKNQPGILINDRHGFLPDYRTPENAEAQYVPGVAQESCQHVGDQWAWKPNDKVPTVKWIIDRIVLNASRNSNLLLNMGPSPQGPFDPNQSERLREAGTWLKSHGPAIFGTRAGPLIDNSQDPAFVTTYNNNLIYVHVLHPNKAGKEIRLPGVRITSAVRFDNPAELLDFRHENDAGIVRLPDIMDPLDEIIKVEASFDADRIHIVDPKTN